MSTSAVRKQKLAQEMAAHYQVPPVVTVRAPGWIDLMGSHTEFHQGSALTLPMNYDTWITASPRPDGIVQLYSLNLQAGSVFNLEDTDKDIGQGWSRCVVAVARQLQASGRRLVGMNGIAHSTLPMTGGLSSWAALECAVATAFEALGGWTMEPLEKAGVCQRAESEFAGTQSGLLGQFTSAAGKEGHAVLLDCRDHSRRLVKLPTNIRVVVCDTRTRREDSAVEFQKRREQCLAGAQQLGVGALGELSIAEFTRKEASLPAEIGRRCRFIIEEHERVARLAEALESGARQEITRVTADSYEGAGKLFQMTTPQMDAMMAAVSVAPGVIGARQAGGGFGGRMVAFVQAERTEAFGRAVKRTYSQTAGVQPEIYPVDAANGAGLVP